MDSEFVKNLLEKLSQVDIESKTNQAPNIFYMLGIENKEVLMCRMLKALIDPYGVHDLGKKPLELFLKTIGFEDFEYKELDKAYVNLEEVIDNDRRVDIVIHIGKKVIPIEVKIYAGDQKNQLYDYYNYYNESKDYKIDKIFYLTPNGKKPLKYSLGELSEDKVVKISFGETINKFLDKLLNDSNNGELEYIIKNLKAVFENMSIRESVLKIVKDITEENAEDKNKLKKSIFALLKYGDDIRSEFERNYFEDSLKQLDKNYSVKIENDDTFNSVDAHCKYAILNDKKETIAFICIETNLYIAKRFENAIDIPGDWTKYPNSNYAWRYIYHKNSNNSKWNLKNIDIDIFDKIIPTENWKEYLK